MKYLLAVLLFVFSLTTNIMAGEPLKPLPHQPPWEPPKELSQFEQQRCKLKLGLMAYSFRTRGDIPLDAALDDFNKIWEGQYESTFSQATHTDMQRIIRDAYRENSDKTWRRRWKGKEQFDRLVETQSDKIVSSCYNQDY